MKDYTPRHRRHDRRTARERTRRRERRASPEASSGYPPGSPVVRAIYTGDFDACTEWRALQELRGRVDGGDLRAYDFPNARLGPLPSGSRRDGEGEL